MSILLLFINNYTRFFHRNVLKSIPKLSTHLSTLPSPFKEHTRCKSQHWAQTISSKRHGMSMCRLVPGAPRNKQLAMWRIYWYKAREAVITSGEAILCKAWDACVDYVYIYLIWFDNYINCIFNYSISCKADLTSLWFVNIFLSAVYSNKKVLSNINICLNIWKKTICTALPVVTNIITYLSPCKDPHKKNPSVF